MSDHEYEQKPEEELGKPPEEGGTQLHDEGEQQPEAQPRQQDEVYKDPNVPVPVTNYVEMSNPPDPVPPPGTVAEQPQQDGENINQ